ncbi:hypothetical protein E7Z59_14375 [Robertkochia marina]|uniref:Uncharacterized protein n=1 Tax=Robertkochia marina TaxID=1227945 RepID=A0A4S3LZQ8_9FLAO|nr:hypothetical protein [Robertkochia marina]THD65769.1 hypothetical protein E7Z59_14375 [Robertkochia marina]TRZ46547.1 hypothetical protein D3A96_02975 [Robertkochia marina]
MLTNTEKIAYTFLAFVFAISLYFGFTDPEFFNGVITREDGVVEYGTAIFLFLIAVLCLYRFITLGKSKGLTWKIGVLGFALLFIFGAGEEISWGQRIFNIESGEYFLENNAQQETNLHNLVVGGKKVNKVIFSQLLMVIMVVYLIVTPILYRKKTWVKNLMDRFAVPVVQWHHTIVFLITSLLVSINPPDRKWEVYELAFGVIFFLIFLNPLNKEIFRKD